MRGQDLLAFERRSRKAVWELGRRRLARLQNRRRPLRRTLRSGELERLFRPRFCVGASRGSFFERFLGRLGNKGLGLSDYSWYLGSLSEWRGPVAEIEPRLAARLAEAAEFNFGLDFTGPEEENPFLAAANEVARFYETRARYRREEDGANGGAATDVQRNGGEDDETSFRYCESEAFDEWEAQEKRNRESDDAQEYDYWENGDFGAFDKEENVTKNKGAKTGEEKSLQEEYAEWDREYHYELGVPFVATLRRSGGERKAKRRRRLFSGRRRSRWFRVTGSGSGKSRTRSRNRRVRRLRRRRTRRFGGTIIRRSASATSGLKRGKTS